MRARSFFAHAAAFLLLGPLLVALAALLMAEGLSALHRLRLPDDVAAAAAFALVGLVLAQMYATLRFLDVVVRWTRTALLQRG